ncbi:MAG TPA: HDOD domain-containing protein [Candidatus Latescibacteria bacterium]|nr:HDOD domain-containing protein [Candidatus Latescibacterota bacterium]
MAQNPDIGLSKVGRVVEVDPALAAIGAHEIIRLALSVSVFPPVPGKPTFDRKAFWKHCTDCGTIPHTRRSGDGLRSDGSCPRAWWHAYGTRPSDYREAVTIVHIANLLRGTEVRNGG